jgi:trk system potassium uptake protein
MPEASWRSRLVLPLLLTAATVLDFLPWAAVGRPLAALAGAAILLVLLARTARGLRTLPRAARVTGLLRLKLTELFVTVAAAALFVSKLVLWTTSAASASGGAYYQYVVGFAAVTGARLALGQLRVRGLLYRLDLAPSQTVAAGFLLVAAGGGLLLSLPVSVQSRERLDLLDALFTATSAVTVTGLTVYDPGSTLTGFGQVVLLALIQIGGVGTMAATASLLLLSRRRIQLKQAAAVQASMDVDTLGHVRAAVIAVLVGTLVLESLGALALHLAWRDLPGAGGVFTAVFHSVSAFCNAGFSLFPEGLTSLVARPAANLVFCLLIVLGGLGFPVLRELPRALPWPGRARRPALSLHARLTLAASGILLVAGTLAILVLEWRSTLAAHPLGVKLLAALFHSVSARTAGFNTLDIAALAPATLTLLMILMFVGGSPGGTAGGIKTTTAATVFLTLRSVLRGRPRVEVRHRTVPLADVHKALAVVGVSLAAVSAGMLLLLATQPGAPVALMFEAVSAFATTGLSAGVTPQLGPGGKLIIMALMFVGRAGPMTLAFAVQARRRQVEIEYPEERIAIG